MAVCALLGVFVRLPGLVGDLGPLVSLQPAGAGAEAEALAEAGTEAGALAEAVAHAGTGAGAGAEAAAEAFAVPGVLFSPVTSVTASKTDLFLSFTRVSLRG